MVYAKSACDGIIYPPTKGWNSNGLVFLVVISMSPATKAKESVMP